MRLPTVADVLEAVTYVAGVDPLTHGRAAEIIHSRRLACHALREITELSYPSIGRAMHLDHTTAMHHCAIPTDYDELRSVAAFVSETLEDEDRAAAMNAWG